MLSHPERDASDQLAEIADIAAQVPVWRAEYADFAAWWTGFSAILDQVVAEVTLGLDEGEDEARRDFLSLADAMIRVAVMALARVQRGADLNTRLAVAPLFRAHLRAWHAVRGARQNVSWLGARGWTSGRLPILALTPLGTLRFEQWRVDAFTSPSITWWDAAQGLNALAGELRWRD